VFRDVVEELARVLAALGVRWVLIGAVAANVYRRETRLTGDVDLLLADAGTDIAALEHEFRLRGWQVRRATPDGDILRMRHPTLGAVDLQTAGTDYQRQAIDRSRRELLESGLAVYVLSVEDVIIHKLIAGRPRDIGDLQSILEVDRPLDEAYLDRWTRFWEVRETWAALRRSRA
jgi:predicted nucleotidyltransferase